MDIAVERRIVISADHAERLRRLAEARQISEGQVVERALDMLFGLTEPLNTQSERQHWSALSDDVLGRIWDNDDDARYDEWADVGKGPVMARDT